MTKRNTEFYKVVKANTERFRKSAVPSMIRQLTDYQKKTRDILCKVDAMPVNSDSCRAYHVGGNDKRIVLLQSLNTVDIIFINIKISRYHI